MHEELNNRGKPSEISRQKIDQAIREVRRELGLDEETSILERRRSEAESASNQKDEDEPK